MGITGDDGIFAEERKKMIVDFVNRNTKATVNELCERFSVSSATIRMIFVNLQSMDCLKEHMAAHCRSQVLTMS